jgi:hypothetical protein
MKNLVKLGVAGALALGGSMAAHATITVPTSSGTTGDVILWADVFNSSGSLVEAFVGDTGVSVDSIGAGNKPSSTYDPSTLSSLLALATGTNTIMWVLEGGGGHSGASGGSPYLVSAAPSLTAIGQQDGQTLTNWGTGISGSIANSVNPLVGTGTSALSTSDAAIGGTDFNPITVGVEDAHNWWGSTGNITTTGLGTQANFYLATASGQAVGDAATLTNLFFATLTSSGLTYTSSVVPIPAALWLLGSGLLGLAGVARRKVSAA